MSELFTSKDASGRNNPLALFSVGLGQVGALADGTTAALFNGTALSYAIANPFSKWPNKDMSFECCFKTSSSARQGIASFARPGDTQDFYLFVQSGLVYAIARGVQIGGAGPVAYDAYHHVVVAIEGGEFRLWLDGARAITGSCQPEVLAESGSFVLGQYQGSVGGGFSESFNGIIDEPAIYDHSLTDAEVARHSDLRFSTAVTLSQL